MGFFVAFCCGDFFGLVFLIRGFKLKSVSRVQWGALANRVQQGDLAEQNLLLTAERSSLFLPFPGSERRTFAGFQFSPGRGTAWS